MASGQPGKSRLDCWVIENHRDILKKILEKPFQRLSRIAKFHLTRNEARVLHRAPVQELEAELSRLADLGEDDCGFVLQE